MTAGYSGTPLAKKLGIKAGSAVAAVNAPADLGALLGPLPAGVEVVHLETAFPERGDENTLANTRVSAFDIVHFFTNSRDELQRGLAAFIKLIKQDGAIWVSWYKRAAKLPTEITEDVIRDVALPMGLVDIKVCAVDEKWSGLKLVIRRENRV
jgi:hypothetical protein